MDDETKIVTGIGSLPPKARVLLATLVMPVAFGLILFISAGRLDWLAGWLYLAVVAVTPTSTATTPN